MLTASIVKTFEVLKWYELFKNANDEFSIDVLSLYHTAHTVSTVRPVRSIRSARSWSRSTYGLYGHLTVETVWSVWYRQCVVSGRNIVPCRRRTVHKHTRPCKWHAERSGLVPRDRATTTYRLIDVHDGPDGMTRATNHQRPTRYVNVFLYTNTSALHHYKPVLRSLRSAALSIHSRLCSRTILWLFSRGLRFQRSR